MWFKVDDTFWGHPKVIALYDGDHAADALALWTRCGSWSGEHLTEGRIPRGFVRQSPHAAGAAELVRVGLWETADDGYQFHDWLDYNPTKAAVEADRAAARARQQAWRERNALRNGVTNVNGHAVTSPSPTRPDPTRIEERDLSLQTELKTRLPLNAHAREEQEPDQGPISRAERELVKRDVALISARDQLKALKSARATTDDYHSKLYDAEQAARQAEEARDRTKRQLEELRDPPPQRMARK